MSEERNLDSPQPEAKKIPETKQTIGWREWVALPQLGIERVKVKVDTGARTSALHAFEVIPFRREDRDWVRFGIHPTQRESTPEVWCEAAVLERRVVRDSGGHEEKRYVIETEVTLGDAVWSIELTLTDRDNMGFRMLLGRTALRGTFIVDPARSYVISRRKGQLGRKRIKAL